MEGLTPTETQMIWAVPGIALLGIIYAFVLRTLALRQDKGTEQMQLVGAYIRSGSLAYLNKQMSALISTTVILAFALAASVLIIPPTDVMLARFGSEEDAFLWASIGRAGAFLAGAIFSYIAASVGMHVAVASNMRAAAVARKSYNLALQAAYRPGVITSILAASLGLLGAAAIVLSFGTAAPDALLGFAAGSALAAIFLRIGSGIYQQTASMSTRMVEEQVNKNDVRSAALVAERVGQHAGETAGRASNLFASMEIAFLAALILGFAFGDMRQGQAGDGLYDMRYVLFPLILRGIGLLSVMIGCALVRTDDKRRNARASLNRGFYITALIAVVGFTAVNFVAMVNPTTGAIDWQPYCAAFAGVVLAVALYKLTEYFTSTLYQPVKGISRAAKTSLSSGMLSSLTAGFQAGLWAVLVVVAAMISSLMLYMDEPAAVQSIAFPYAVALTAIGFLTLVSSTLAIGSFGAVAHNAQSIGQLSNLEKNPRNVLEDLAAVGSTTRLAASGVLIGGAIVGAAALWNAMLVNVGQVQTMFFLPPISEITVTTPAVLAGLLLGGGIPLLFAVLVLPASARASTRMLQTIQQQLALPEVLQGEEAPDYAGAIRVTMAAIQQRVTSLCWLAVLLPLVVGFGLGVEALGGFLVGTILVSLLLAAFHTSAGGVWENARRYIEEGFYGGKNSAAHRAALTGGTASEALGTVSAPAFVPLMNLMIMVSVISAPIVSVIRLPGQPLTFYTMVGVGLALLTAIGLVWQGTRPDKGEVSLPGELPPLAHLPPLVERQPVGQEEENLLEEEFREEEVFDLEEEAFEEEPEEPELEPEPAEKPEPEPEPEPEPAEKPAPEPEPAEKPAPEPEPAEKPAPEPEPAEKPAPEPEPAEKPAPEPEPAEKPAPSRSRRSRRSQTTERSDEQASSDEKPVRKSRRRTRRDSS